MENLKKIREILQEKISEGKRVPYYIPSLWIASHFNNLPQVIEIDPYSFFAQQIDFILSAMPSSLVPGIEGSWSSKAVVYNFMVHLTTAFDHNQNGILDLPMNKYGFRETGTFLKSIALLPYLQKLGVNTVHLMPVTSIGQDGKKGTLGSPYAIKNPFHLDENLSEPFISVGVETEFKAFVEAAHHLGIRVIVEFVFRTASKNSDWVKEHPDWFYWIKDSVPNRERGSADPHHFGAPIFPPEDLKKIIDGVHNGNLLSETIPPSEDYQNMFTAPPLPDQITDENGKWIGILSDGTKVRIPGAFADWPPDDPQPPWEDVTYLKLYHHPEFNYMAYNTVRMYDQRLAKKENINQDLWRTITDIVPHYQDIYGIDGVMIDMGHALPLPLLKQIVHRAREINPDFAFWEENFSTTEESRIHGYNAVMGYLWCDEHHPHKLKNLLERYSKEKLPLPMFGSSESHNSPRSVTRGGIKYSKMSFIVNSFLPAMLFIHSGFELGEDHPVNTGLDFTPEEHQKYPEESLPLFSASSLNWTSSLQFCSLIQHILRIRERCIDLITDPNPHTIKQLESIPPQVIAFERKNSENHIVIAVNTSMTEEAESEIQISPEENFLYNLISQDRLSIVDGKTDIFLDAGQFKIFRVI